MRDPGGCRTLLARQLVEGDDEENGSRQGGEGEASRDKTEQVREQHGMEVSSWLLFCQPCIAERLTVLTSWWLAGVTDASAIVAVTPSPLYR